MEIFASLVQGRGGNSKGMVNTHTVPMIMTLGQGTSVATNPKTGVPLQDFAQMRTRISYQEIRGTALSGFSGKVVSAMDTFMSIAEITTVCISNFLTKLRDSIARATPMFSVVTDSTRDNLRLSSRAVARSMGARRGAVYPLA